MNTPSTLQFVVPVLVVALGLMPSAALAQAGAKELKPPKVAKTTAIDLGPEVEGMQGRQLRMRVIQLEPGAGVAQCAHKERPEVVYVAQGTITESMGGKVTQYRAGDTWKAGKDTAHGLQNNGTEPVTLVFVDVFKAP